MQGATLIVAIPRSGDQGPRASSGPTPNGLAGFIGDCQSVCIDPAYVRQSHLKLGRKTTVLGFELGGPTL
jgi:hypothetical protein